LRSRRDGIRRCSGKRRRCPCGPSLAQRVAGLAGNLGQLRGLGRTGGILVAAVGGRALGGVVGGADLPRRSGPARDLRAVHDLSSRYALSSRHDLGGRYAPGGTRRRHGPHAVGTPGPADSGTASNRHNAVSTALRDAAGRTRYGILRGTASPARCDTASPTLYGFGDQRRLGRVGATGELPALGGHPRGHLGRLGGAQCGLVGGGWGAPDASGEGDGLGLGRRREPGPGPGLAHVAQLRLQQLGEPLALDDRPGRQPGDDSGRDQVDHVPRRVERQSDEPEQERPRGQHTGEDADPDYGERHRQPQVVKLVEPLLNPPDIGIRGQVHAVPPLHPLARSMTTWARLQPFT
jgi:hypothetical protein